MFNLCHLVLRRTFQRQKTHLRISSKTIFLWWVKLLTLYKVGIYHYFHLLELEPLRGSNFGLLLFLCFSISIAVEYSSCFISVLNLDTVVAMFCICFWQRKRGGNETKTLHKRGFPNGVQLLVFFCSSVPVVLFDTPGISRCRSQHVSVESSSLLHHSIYLWFICFTWWSIDELENHADRTTVCFEPW